MNKTIRKNQIWHKAGGRCAHCGATHCKRTIDHIIPKSRGGGTDRDNLMPLCRKCNEARGSKEIDIDEFYPFADEWERNRAKSYMSRWKKERRTLE